MVVGGSAARKPVPMLVALLVTLALMLAPAAQREAHAEGSGPGQGKCIREAAKAGLIGPELNPSNTTFISGTNGDDRIDRIHGNIAADEVYCGFGGNDRLYYHRNSGVVLGGPGNDHIEYNTGTFYGGAGNDSVEGNSVTFNGGEGNDGVYENSGIFNGGEGDDGVFRQLDRPNATFNGGPGCDRDIKYHEGGTVDLGDQSGCPA